MFSIAASLVLAGASPACDVPDYRTWKEKPGQQWDYRTSKLTMIGAVHSRDPEHEQFARIAAAFAAAKPTLALFEGPDRGIAESAEDSIRNMGESGYLRFLAKQAGIASRSIEPSPPEQVKALVGQFPADQILLFFVLREATRMRDREKVEGAELDRRVNELLAKVKPMAAAAGLAGFDDTAAMQAAFVRYWPGRDWKSADARWFSPSGDDGASGGVFTAAINRADSMNRDRRIVGLLSEAVAKGETPFVLVGRNHVPMVAAALDCALAT